MGTDDQPVVDSGQPVATAAQPVVATAQPVATGIDIWQQRVAASGDRVAFRYATDGGAWKTMTWREADVAARGIAAGLATLGVSRADAVCLLAQTRVEWVLCDVGILLTGGATVPIYPSSTADQCAFIARDVAAKVVIAEDAVQLDKVLPLYAQMPGLRVVYLVGPPPATSLPPAQAPISLAALRASGRDWLESHAGEIERRIAGLGPNDLFTIIHTSGTTGTPKGVVLTHDNLISACGSAIRALTLQASDLQLLFLPLAHVLARELEWAVILVGAQTAFCESPTRIKENLVAVRPTFMAGVPRIFEKLFNGIQAAARQGPAVKVSLVSWAFEVGKRHAAAVRNKRPPGFALQAQHAIADKLVLGRIRARLGLDRSRFLVCGGAPLAAEIAEYFHGLGLLVLEGYGLTETMAAAFLNRLDQYRFGTVGPPIDVIEHKIDDDGEILMRGRSVFKRYHNNPSATTSAIDPAGWFHSGDIGQIEDGFLRITDRKKDLIVTAGGKNVAPQFLENGLKARCPLLSQVVVFGDRRPYCVALVTLAEDAIARFGARDPIKAAASAEARAAIQQDIDTLNATLPPHERIRSFAILPADLSEAAGGAPSLKIKRKLVVDKYRATIDSLYQSAAA